MHAEHRGAGGGEAAVLDMHQLVVEAFEGGTSQSG
jgi:hypothetical protein